MSTGNGQVLKDNEAEGATKGLRVSNPSVEVSNLFRLYSS